MLNYGTRGGNLDRPVTMGPAARLVILAGFILAGFILAACGSGVDTAGPGVTTDPRGASVPATVDGAGQSGPALAEPGGTEPGSGPSTSGPSGSTAATTPRPAWLGTRVLPVGEDGFGQIRPTPPELADRRFPTVDVLAPPEAATFASTVTTVPPEVVARSTWSPACPVAIDDLRYLTVPFWGFDARVHTGELLVHADAVDVARAGFEVLFDRRFPIEEMRITTVDELDAAPTGDGNVTGSFVCRPARGSTTWSEHAYGRAIDINPFHNPFVKGDVILPELASAYADRSVNRPGMMTADDVAGFTDHGWGWGGRWNSLKDYMHLSSNGR